MQVNEDYLDDWFARKLGNLEANPPEDGWVRIETELNRRSRATKRYWLAAASFALILSATATMVYIKTNINTDADQTMIAVVQDHTPQIADNQASVIQGDQSAAQPVAQPNRQQATNPIAVQHIPQGQLPTQATVVYPPENTQVAMQEEVAVPDIHEDVISNPSNHPVYMDSWNEMLKAQPAKESLRQSMSEKIAQLTLETYKNEGENVLPIVSPTMAGYDEIIYRDETGSYTKSPSRKRWAITGQFAPMFSYRTISSVPGGMRKSDFDAAESPLLAYSGGITLSRNVMGRFSVQVGLYYSQMGQAINNLVSVPNMYAAMSSINPYNKNFVRTSSGNVIVASNLKSDVNTAYDAYFNPESQSANNPVAAANIASPSNYRLIERIDYLEIPVMLRYKIVDRKLNIYVLGGMSVNALINNNVFIDNGKELVKGGTILMARPVNYNSTLGFGIGYQINRSLLVEVEPLFKYFLQPYTTSSQIGSNPYAFGMFTGVIYRF